MVFNHIEEIHVTRDPSRSIRQGCPLSSLLFILVVEILAHKIRTNRIIEGIKVKVDSVKSLKITQLADDTTLFVKNETDIKHSLLIVDEFGKHSGLKLNRGKTEGLWIGSSKYSVVTSGRHLMERFHSTVLDVDDSTFSQIEEKNKNN